MMQEYIKCDTYFLGDVNHILQINVFYCDRVISGISTMWPGSSFRLMIVYVETCFKDYHFKIPDDW